MAQSAVLILPGIGRAFLGGGSAQIAAGFLGTVVPVLIGVDTASPGLLGQVTSAYFAGFVLGALLAPALLMRLGLRGVFASVMLAQAGCALLLPLVPHWGWIGLRGVMGLCGAMGVVVMESWINSAAPAGHRARFFSLFNFCGRLAMITGQTLAASGWALSPLATLLPAALYCIATFSFLPLLDRDGGGREGGSVRAMLAGLLRLPRAPALAIVHVGATGSTLVFIAPGWGTLAGLPPAEAALLTVAVQSGSFLLQWPLAMLADRWSRRGIILAAMAGATAVALLLLATGLDRGPMLFALFAAMGGLALPLYAIAYAGAFDAVMQASGPNGPSKGGRPGAVALAGGLLLCWAAGGFLGPALVGTAIVWFGPRGLFAGIALLSAIATLSYLLSSRRGQ